MNFTDPSIERYCLDHTTAEASLYRELHEETYATMEIPQMLAGRMVGATLQLLIRLVGAQRVVEVGTFTGYSSLKMAQALPDDGVLFTLEVEPRHAAVAQRAFERAPWGSKITLLQGPAMQSLEQIDGPIDLSFIDADKENYVRYYRHLVEKTRPGGVIVLDNALWSGSVLKPVEESAKALAQMNAVVHADERVDNLLLPVRDGLMIAQKKA